MTQEDIIKRCIDNTAKESRYEDLGVLFFAREFLSQCRGYRQSIIHYKMMKEALDLFNPKYRNRLERQKWIKIFREGAKSTYFSFAFPLYLINLVGGTIYVRSEAEGWEGSDRHDYDIFEVNIGKEFILILSETHASAERFTMNIRTEIEGNRYLRDIFGDKSPRGIEDETTGLWRRDSFITSDGVIIFGQGAGQQIRGMLPYGMRPTLAIFDDIYSRKNTVTQQTREKIRYWFFAEAINSVDTMNGKVILVGTMLHEDTVFTDVAKSNQWKGVEYPVISEEELQIAISKCSIDESTGQLMLPSENELDEMQKSFKSLAWRDRQNIRFILSSYKEKHDIGKTSYFYQEYLHILSSPDDITYKDEQVTFTPITYYRQDNNNIIEITWNTYRWSGVCNLLIGVDIASSEREASDDTAILIGGWAKLYPIIDGYDYIASLDMHPHKRNGIHLPVMLDGCAGKFDVYSTNDKKGIVNTVIEYVQKYRIKNVIVETNAQQGLIYREIKKKLYDVDHTVLVKSHNTTNRKEDEINSCLLPIFQGSKTVVFNKIPIMYNTFTQLKHLGVASKDDCADAMKNIFIYAKQVINGYDPQSINDLHIATNKKKTLEYETDWMVY